MKILMIAPQPFMDKREAPSVIYNHSKALIQIGFEVDLVTYHMGESADLPGLNVFRIPHLPFMHRVKVGPSFARLPLDLLVFFLAFWRLCCNRYDYLHTHEEAGLMGVILSAIFGTRHLYYIHSDLSQQIARAKFTHNTLSARLTRRMQNFTMRHTDGIITACIVIEKHMHEMVPYTPIYLIEDCVADEHDNWPIFLQKSLQVQKDFTGAEISIDLEQAVEEELTPCQEASVSEETVENFQVSQIEKVEETICAV